MQEIGRKSNRPYLDITIEYKGIEKDLVFGSEDIQRGMDADSVLISTRKGWFGFDVFMDYDVIDPKVYSGQELKALVPALSPDSGLERFDSQVYQVQYGSGKIDSCVAYVDRRMGEGWGLVLHSRNSTNVGGSLYKASLSKSISKRLVALNLRCEESLQGSSSTILRLAD